MIEDLDRFMLLKLIKEDLDRGMQHLQDELARVVYAPSMRPALPTPTWRTRWTAALRPIRGYLVTLWWALRGDDLHHYEDEED